LFPDSRLPIADLGIFLCDSRRVDSIKGAAKDSVSLISMWQFGQVMVGSFIVVVFQVEA
jgi:hypothetical protein